MITRKEYLDTYWSDDPAERDARHHRYYKQFVTDYELATVASKFGDRIIRSTDAHLNDIPLREWDMIPLSNESCRLLKQAGDCGHPSSSMKVCVLKAAARMYANSIAEQENR